VSNPGASSLQAK